MIPALSCLPFLTASLSALLPSVVHSGPQSFRFSPPAAHVLFFCTPLNLYFSLSAFYFPSPSLWLLSWPFLVAPAVIHHEHLVTLSPIDWASLSFALKQQNSQDGGI